VREAAENTVLKWKGVEGAVGYEVYFGAAPAAMMYLALEMSKGACGK
jgi:hypothetical protein